MIEGSVISHVGIAVANLEEAIARYAVITGDYSPHIADVPDQKVRVAIFAGRYPGGRIELVAPTADDSPISRFIRSRGEGLHHVCVYVNDIHVSLENLRRAGAKLIDEKPRVGAEGNLIAFVHPAHMNGVLIELEQRAST